MIFKLNSFNNDHSSGHSVYQFSLLESETPSVAKQNSSISGDFYNEGYGINSNGIKAIIIKLAQIKMEAFTIKQLLN